MDALRPTDPEWIGRYRIVGRLGSGGMGQVYLGRAPSRRLVAVKVVRPELADDPRFRERFAREVAAARSVTGFFTAAVVGADPDGSPPWLATAYVPGMALDNAVATHGPWPTESVRILGTGVAEALEAIHAAGLVHRDLKPANVLIAVDGPRVVDFGISVAAEATALTRTGMIVGTPGFMAPEQLQGRPVTPATDVFALGALLTYAATGTGPFGTGSAQSLNFRIAYEDPDLSALPAPGLEIVASCLAKDPDMRPRVPDLIDELAPTASHATGYTPTEVVSDDASSWIPAGVVAGLHSDGAGLSTAASGAAGGTPAAAGETRTAATPTSPTPAPAPPSPPAPVTPASQPALRLRRALPFWIAAGVLVLSLVLPGYGGYVVVTDFTPAYDWLLLMVVSVGLGATGAVLLALRRDPTAPVPRLVRNAYMTSAVLTTAQFCAWAFPGGLQGMSGWALPLACAVQIHASSRLSAPGPRSPSSPVPGGPRPVVLHRTRPYQVALFGLALSLPLSLVESGLLLEEGWMLTYPAARETLFVLLSACAGAVSALRRTRRRSVRGGVRTLHIAATALGALTFASALALYMSLLAENNSREASLTSASPAPWSVAAGCVVLACSAFRIPAGSASPRGDR